MRKAIPILVVLAALGLAGCDDSTSSTAPRDITPPAAPRGLFSVTGDGQARLNWLANTESDVAGYRVYQAACASGTDCPYDRIGTTSATQFIVTGLGNGVTRYFAVAAVDRAGNESALTPEDVFDTPRPAGSGTLNNFVNTTTGAGWDFSAFVAKASTDPTVDVFFGDNGSVAQMFCKDLNTDIQDAGYASSMDAVDFSPVGPDKGWSPTGTAELIPGHVYIVWTRDDHYAKFRVTGLSGSLVSFDWAYQTAQGNPELRARRAPSETQQLRPIHWIR
ncbi:MAG: hypothetical protein ABL977_10925 [Candidatus Eisenbacteria bacterium]